MVLVDLTSIGLNGKDAEISLGKVNIVANRNTIPYDQNPPGTGSGIRLGTAAITSRGMGQKEATRIGKLILQTLTNLDNDKISNEVKSDVSDLAEKFHVPGINAQ
jgi:glycine hydroxymethyltransferase